MPDRPNTKDPLQPADDASRAQARALLTAARHGALAVIDPATQTPGISRIAVGICPEGWPMTLISSLAAHRAALTATPAAALMVGDVGAKGDPLTHPRLMIRVSAQFIAADDPTRPYIRAKWLQDHPKATLYVDFADFAFCRLMPVSALLNGGFGRAYALTPDDLRN